MKQVSSKEFQRNFGRYQDEALVEPLSITKNGRERLVVVSAELFHELEKRPKTSDRKVLHVSELSDSDLEAIENAEMPEAFNVLNKELDG